MSDIPTLRRILAQSCTIAVVGLSADWFRPSYFAAKYMITHGYTVIPVNPRYAEILGQKSYKSLRDIPAGSTLSYTELAERIGAPKSVRAVAGACAANVLAVAIPCHRVLRHDGSLSGYRWGVARKRALLARESGGGSDFGSGP